MAFVDTNVILDILEEDPTRAGWSEAALAQVSTNEPVHTNYIVVAELAAQFFGGESPLEALTAIGVALIDLDEVAAFQAGGAFLEYRRRGGKREAIITDFLIAGHAAAGGWSLLTRDRKRLGTYFPDLTLITPERTNG